MPIIPALRKWCQEDQKPALAAQEVGGYHGLCETLTGKKTTVALEDLQLTRLGIGYC